MNIAKNSFWVLATQMVGFVFSIGISIVTARWLEPEGKGIMTMVLLVSSLCIMIASLGIGMSNTYYIGQRKYSPAEILFHSVLLALGASVVILPLFFVSYPYLKDSLLKGIDIRYILIGLFEVPFSLLASHINGIFFGIKDIGKLNLTAIFTSVVGTALTLVALVGLGAGIRGAVIAHALGVVASTLFALFLLDRTVPLRFSWNKALTKDVVSYGMKAQSANLLSFLSLRMNMFLVNFWASPLQVGYLSVAVAVAEMIWLIPRSVLGVLFSEVSSRDSQRGADIVATISRHMTFISVVSCIILGLLGQPLLRFVYGEAYLPAMLPLLLLLPGIFLQGAAYPISSYFPGTGRVIYGPIIVGMQLVVNLLFNIFFIPRWGIAGAALASTISSSAAVTLAVVLFFRLSNKNFSDTFIIKPTDLRLYLKAVQRVLNGVYHAKKDAKIYFNR